LKDFISGMPGQLDAQVHEGGVCELFVLAEVIEAAWLLI
jgi:hypothetical protein